MKKYIIAFVLFMFLALCLNVFSQEKTYPFEFVKSGNGKQSIIFIPGFACSGEVWNDTKSQYEKNFTCYTLTMSGFAGAKPMSNPSFNQWETGIANFIKTNNIDKPIIIGHSMGGGLALALAADYPELIQKIIVVDALPCLFALNNPSFIATDNAACLSRTKQLVAATNDQFYQMQKMSAQSLVLDSVNQELIANWSLKSDRQTFVEMFCDFSNTDLRFKLKNITCPSLILLEAPFKDMKPAIENQYKDLKTANLQYANKGLHFIMFDDKEWYNSQLNNFLNSNK